MRMPRVAVVGGSIGGLTAALLLRDAGCEVDVFERGAVLLSGYGAGIVVQPELSRYFLERTDLTLERISVPSRGIFDPSARGEHELYAAIESVARNHLEMGEARGALRKALDSAALPIEQRDEIERATLEIQSASDTAYFYAGLAFGLAFSSYLKDGAR